MNRFQRLADMFETTTRDDGTTFVRLRDGSPQWATDVVREAHGGLLPDDWRYKTLREAAELLAEHADDGEVEDLGAEFADDVDVYNRDLLAWLASSHERVGYVDEALGEYGVRDGLMRVLMRGQAAERREAFALLVQALEWLDDEEG